MNLNSRIKGSGISKVYIAKELHISRQALYNKLTGVSKFNVYEVAKLSQILRTPVQVITEEAMNERH